MPFQGSEHGSMLLPSPSSCGRRAMSVMSSNSYQYTATNDDAYDTMSVHSAPAPPEDTPCLSGEDLRQSLESYEALLSTASVYKDQLIQLSDAAANFGSALEKVARGKCAAEAAQGLQAAAGLQFLISNHQQILSDMVAKTFETPLRERFEQHKLVVKQSQKNYDAALHHMRKKIRDTEAENLKNGRKGQRDIRQFRRTLRHLTYQVDELDRIKSGYHEHMANVERQNHSLILGKTAAIVRAQVDIHERISNKGLVDPTLEEMMRQNPDPFCAYETASDEAPGMMFTVLPSGSLIDAPLSLPFCGDDPDHSNDTTGYATTLLPHPSTHPSSFSLAVPQTKNGTVKNNCVASPVDTLPQPLPLSLSPSTSFTSQCHSTR